jgi:hypothetical protein
MPPGTYVLRKFQVGIEATHGTRVPAAWLIPGEFTFTPQRGRYMADFPRGVRFPVTGGGVDISQGSIFSGNIDGCFEELVYPFATGLAVPTIATASSVSTWTFTPPVAADPAPKSFSMEYVVNDGTNNVFASGAGFGLSQRLSLNFAFNQKVAGTWSGFAQAEVAGITPTPALTAITGREVMVSNLTSWYIDTTWAGLGGTQKLGTIRSARMDWDFKLTPDPTMDGRANLDFGQYAFDYVGCHLQLVCEHNLNAQTEIAAWRNRTYRFIRAKTVGSTIPTTATAKSAQFDLSMVYSKEPAFSRAGMVELATLDLDVEYDPTSAKGAIVTIVNGNAALT